MILNFLYTFLYVFILLKTCIIYEIVSFTPGDNTPILDFHSRALDYDFVLNRFYFFWTNFFYLYHFLNALVLYLIIHKFSRQVFWLLFWLTLPLLSNCVLIYDYWLLNLEIKQLSAELLNSLLLNSINKFHPLLFYLTTLFVMLYSLQLFNRAKFYIRTGLRHNSLMFALQILVLTLFLGAWWALQEGSWGGWWNWDPSEVLGLLAVLNYLNLIHSKRSPNVKKKNLIYLTFASQSLVLIYLLIQLNFDLVSHNFGTRTNTFASTLELLTSETLVLLILIPFLIFLKTNLLIFRKNNLPNFSLYNPLLLLLTLTLLYFSFKLLITDSLWQFVLFNSSNYFFNLQLIILYLSMLLALYTWGLTLVVVFTIVCLYCNTNPLIINSLFLLNVFVLTNSQHLLHSLLIFFTYFNIETYFKAVLIFDKDSLIFNHHASFNDTIIYITSNLTSKYISFEKSVCTSLGGTTNSQWFSKFSTENFLEQVLKEGSVYLNYSVHIFEFGHTNLLATFILTLSTLLYQKNTKQKITF